MTFFLLASLPLAASSSLLTWVLLLPLACGTWVLRARVVAAPAGLEVCNGLGVRRFAWHDIDGFRVTKRGPVRLLPAGARPLPLLALPRRELPLLLAIGERSAATGPAADRPTDS